MNKNRVFLIDYDLISPLGIGKETVFRNLQNNTLCGSYIERFNANGLVTNIAAEIKEDLSVYYADEPASILKSAKYDRTLELTLACYGLMRSRLERIFSESSPDKCGISIGVGFEVTPFELIESELREFIHNPQIAYLETINKLNDRSSHINTLLNPLDLPAMYLANKLKAGLFQRTLLTACSASTQAVAIAFDSIRCGEAELVLAGGSDSILNLVSYASFTKLGVVQAYNGPPQYSCKPFDLNRSGGILIGEAASFQVLASEKFVKDHGYNPKIEVIGYGSTLDGYKITSVEPQARGMRRAIIEALKSSNLKTNEVDYINFHGTGTASNDPLEIKAFKDVFGNSSGNIPVSSTKDRHGHAIAAAGAQELSIVMLCMENNLVPCNVNLEKPIDTDIDLVKGENREKELKVCLSNNFAFGGVNTVLALRKL